jgi:hypothetical protein
MSSLKKLDLQDAFRASREPRNIHKPLIIEQQTQKEHSVPFGRILIGLVMCSFIIALIKSISYSRSDSFTRQKKLNLRKIIRMNCVTDVSTYCSTDYSGGEYVVNIGNCPDVYEFNGIPFTDIVKDNQGNYRVPGSADLTMIINYGCDEITATMDTLIMSKNEYASKNSGDGELKKVVWISKKCFTAFTLKIDGHVVLDKSPVNMLESKKLLNIVAYTYKLNVPQNGPVSVVGIGCSAPIYIYTLRS